MSKEILSVLLNPECYVPTATLAFLKVFGLEALEWDPVIVKQHVEEVLGQSVSEKNLDKINAGTTIIFTNIAEIYPQCLINFCHVSVDANPDMAGWNSLEPEELVQGLVDFALLTNREYTPRDECVALVQFIFFEAGFHKIPACVMALANLDDAEIPMSKTEDKDVQKEKDIGMYEYVTEVTRNRINQLKQIENKE